MKFGFDNFKNKSENNTQPEELQNWSENFELEKVLNHVKSESIDAGVGYKKILKNISKKILYGTLIYAVTAIGIESIKRKLAIDEYEKLKNTLEEYKLDSVIDYGDKYLQVVEIFGVDNVSPLQDISEYEKSYDNTFKSPKKTIENSIKESYNIEDIAFIGLVAPILAPEYFFSNFPKNQAQKYAENVKNSLSVSSNRSNNYMVLQNFYDNNYHFNKTNINEEDKLVIKNDKREDTVTVEILNKIINETYPKDWFNREVRQIKLTNSKDGATHAQSQYTNGNKFEEAARMSRYINEMVLRNYSLKTPWFLFHTLSHEASHANDWEANEDLTSVERVDLLLKINNRIKSPNRFISSYVEGINNDNKETEGYLKCVEYFAEICGEYFTFGKKNLNMEDVGIIEFVVNKKDLNFNIDVAINKRLAIINTEIYRKKNYNPEIANNKIKEYYELSNVIYSQHDKIKIIYDEDIKNGIQNPELSDKAIVKKVNDNHKIMERLIVLEKYFKENNINFNINNLERYDY